MNEKHTDEEIIEILSKQNKSLIDKLCFAQKCTKLLVKYRNCLTLFNDNCECDRNHSNKLTFSELEIEYNKIATIDNCRQKLQKALKNTDCFELTESDHQIDVNSFNVQLINDDIINSDTNEEINDVIVISEIKRETNESTINSEIVDNRSDVSVDENDTKNESQLVVNEQPINNNNNEFVYASDSIVFPSVPFVNPQLFSTQTRHRKAISRTRCYICPRKYDKKASVRCRICCLLICKTCQHTYCSNCSVLSVSSYATNGINVMSGGRCYICPRALDRKASKRCKLCKRLICRTCKHVYCVNCDSDRLRFQTNQITDQNLPLSGNYSWENFPSSRLREKVSEKLSV